MEDLTREKLKEQLDYYGKNYQEFVAKINKRIELLQEETRNKVSDVDTSSLSLEARKAIIEKLIYSGKLSFLFREKASEEGVGKLEELIRNAIKEFLPIIPGKIHKHEQVAWLRENEKPYETFSYYKQGNCLYNLFVKAGLNQRSYKLWTDGFSNYVEVYYKHMNSLKPYSFLPHNDKRFSLATSSFMNKNAELRTYLDQREKVWLSSLDRNLSWENNPIESILAFGYAFSTLQDNEDENVIKLEIEKDPVTGLSIRLLCYLQLDKEEFTALLQGYEGTAASNYGFSFKIAFGKDYEIVEEGGPRLEGTNAFYKISECMRNSKEKIARHLRKNDTLVASELEDDQLFDLFINILEQVALKKRKIFWESRELMEKSRESLARKIEKLRADADSLQGVELHQELDIVKAMQAQMIAWYKFLDSKLRHCLTEEDRCNRMNQRDLE